MLTILRVGVPRAQGVDRTFSIEQGQLGSVPTPARELRSLVAHPVIGLLHAENPIDFRGNFILLFLESLDFGTHLGLSGSQF